MNETINKLKELLENDKKTIEENYKENERLKEENTILKQTMSNNSLLINENALLKSIIKEVREYINKIPTQPVIRVFKKELLEILDKGSDKE